MSRAQGIADQLSHSIFSGTSEPGERLGTKDELRDWFNVATGTLNEAIRLLETQGLIDAKPGPRGGIFVARPSAHVRLSHLILNLGHDGLPVADWLEIREALEAPIAMHAARNAQHSDIEHLRALVRDMGECGEDPKKYIMANWALHEAIAALSANSLMQAIYVSLLDTARESLRSVSADVGYKELWRHNWQLHVDLIEAVASGDETAAAAAAVAHRPLIESISADTHPDRSTK